MAANSSINYNNHQRHDDKKGKGESKMSLSDLPNEILEKIIFNHLPTKYAIQTSVLSKKYVDIWKGISKIDLEELGPPEKRQLFMDFVDKILVVFESSLITHFSLIFEVGEEASRVSEWLRVFANPKSIEELKLELGSVREPIVFPDDFFTSETLTKLQLSMEQVFNIPSSISFQNLVSLTLKHVTFPSRASTEELFRGCKFLKELTLIDCKWPQIIVVVIMCPLLEKLTIREWKDDDDDGPIQHEEQGIIPIVPDFLRPCKIMIMGNNLKVFSYDGDLINEYFLSCAVSIINATIEVHGLEENNMNHFWFVYNLIRILSNVRKLTLSDYAIEVLSVQSNLVGYLPWFHQLVELCVGKTSPIILSSQALQAILHRSPLLEEVVFNMGVSLGENSTNEVDSLPACFTTHLKMITIYNFCGNEGEINAIKFLLKTTPLLDTLDIYCNPFKFDSSDGVETLDRLYNEIEQFPTASQDVQLNLE